MRWPPKCQSPRVGPREYAEHRYWRDYTKRNIRLHK
jgi:hypothetical protein